MGLNELELVVMDWVDLDEGRNRWRALVNTVIEPSACIRCREILETPNDRWRLDEGSAPWS
jgi:hypothetical protein